MEGSKDNDRQSAGRTSSHHEASIATAAALFTFLLVTKFSLLLWNVIIKGSRPLADVPPDGVFYIVGADLLLCLAVAVACLVLYRLEPRGSRVGRWIGRFARGAMCAAIIVFCVVSFQVARIYGEPLDVELLRSADSLMVLRESIWAYLGPMPAILLLYGLVCVPLLARHMTARLAQRRWLRPQWQLWSAVVLLCVGAAFMQRARLHRIDTFGVKDNAVVFFVKEYTPPYRAIDAPRLISDLEGRLDSRRRHSRPPRSLVTTSGLLQRDFRFMSAADAGRDLNLIVIQMESTSALHVDAQSAPNISALAGRGLSFKRHVTTATQTRPASIGLYYSDYMPDLGTTPKLVYGRPMPQVSLAEVLRRAGYRTGVFHTGFLDYVDLRYLFQDKGVNTLVGAREMVAAGAKLAYSAGVREEETVDAMCAWIRQQQGQKFFAAYLTEFPHHPYVSVAEQKPFPDDSWLHRYKNSLHYADSAVGRLVRFLERQGLMERTLIVVVGDHGETVSAYPVGHGLRVSDEEMRTPFVLHNPALFPKAVESRLSSSHLDVAPTVVGLLGLDAPRNWLGRNLTADEVPAVMQFVSITHIRRTCVVDNGLVYAQARDANGYEMYEAGDRELHVLDRQDPRRALSAAYRNEADWFAQWSAWRHLKRASSGTQDLAQYDPVEVPIDGGGGGDGASPRKPADVTGPDNASPGS